MVVRMKSTRSHTGHRRSHHALTDARLSVCKNCNAKHLRHRVCTGCGMYRGKVILDTKAKLDKKIKKAKKKKEKLGKD